MKRSSRLLLKTFADKMNFVVPEAYANYWHHGAPHLVTSHRHQHARRGNGKRPAGFTWNASSLQVGLGSWSRGTSLALIICVLLSQSLSYRFITSLPASR